jgi:phage/plasmid-like protein (TIGR03299 family)
MAHLVENMAYVGQTPWHGLGNQLKSNQPIEVWIDQAGMNWEIQSTPVRYLTNSRNRFGEIKEFTDKKVLYRSDSRSPLSVVSNRFHVVQPREILEFYRDLTEKSGFVLETAGVLKEGRKLWALAYTGQSGLIAGNDETRGYLLLATACDGSMATTAQFTSVRVVCNNTLAIATRSSDGAIKVPHNTKFDASMVKSKLGINPSRWDEFIYQLKTLSQRKLKDKEVEHYLTQVFSYNDDQKATSRVQDRSVAKVRSLYEGEGRGSMLASAHGTAFGLLNAVTQFVDHEKRARSTDHRLDSAWFGQGALIKQKALNEAMSLVA